MKEERYYTVFGYDEDGLCYVESFLDYSDALFWMDVKTKDDDYEGVKFHLKTMSFDGNEIK